jgi:hypothetical protein
MMSMLSAPFWVTVGFHVHFSFSILRGDAVGQYDFESLRISFLSP